MDPDRNEDHDRDAGETSDSSSTAGWAVSPNKNPPRRGGCSYIWLHLCSALVTGGNGPSARIRPSWRGLPDHACSSRRVSRSRTREGKSRESSPRRRRTQNEGCHPPAQPGRQSRAPARRQRTLPPAYPGRAPGVADAHHQRQRHRGREHEGLHRRSSTHHRTGPGSTQPAADTSGVRPAAREPGKTRAAIHCRGPSRRPAPRSAGLRPPRPHARRPLHRVEHGQRVRHHRKTLRETPAVRAGRRIPMSVPA